MDENAKNFRELMDLVCGAESETELDSLFDRAVSWNINGYLYDEDYDIIVGCIDARMRKMEG